MKKSIILLSAMLFFLVGCSSDAGDKEVEKNEFSIGETASVKDLNITVNSIRILKGNDYFKPEEGNEWIAIDMTFENTGKESKSVSSMLEFTLKDADGRSKELNVFGETNGSLDGDVMAGEKMTGEISFEVSSEDSLLNLYYKAAFSSKEAVKFNIR